MSSPQTMKRWLVSAGASSYDDLHLEAVPLPQPGPEEIRVKVHAVSLNYRDITLIRGQFRKASSNFVPIADGAGEVDAIGSDVKGWTVGDRVMSNYFPTWKDGPPASGQALGLGAPGSDGMLAEYVILKAERVTALPNSITYEEGACLPCAALTAWTALNGDRPYRHAVNPNTKILVTGTGGVALFATLLGKAYGATVVMTTSDDSKVDKAKALGAAHVVNYKTCPDWPAVAVESVGAFDLVVNAAGPALLDQSIAALAPGGEVALMGLYEFSEKAPNLMALMIKGATIRGTAVGSHKAFQDLVDFVDVNGIKPPIGQQFAFADAKKAYEAASSGKVFGKVVIKVQA